MWKDAGSVNWSFSWADFQWASTMVITRGVKCQDLKLSTEMSESNWFYVNPGDRWPKEIALVLYFDMLNHTGKAITYVCM